MKSHKTVVKRHSSGSTFVSCACGYKSGRHKNPTVTRLQAHRHAETHR